MILGVIPGIDFLGLEFPEIEIVVGSLEDCVCISDTVRSLFSLISSSELLFKPDCKGKICTLGGFSRRITAFSRNQCI